MLNRQRSGEQSRVERRHRRPRAFERVSQVQALYARRRTWETRLP